MSDFGYGQARPEDSASDFNRVSFLIRQILNTIATATLVQVKAVTNEGGVDPVGFVDVLPLVNLIDGLGNASSHGTVFNIPYCRVQGGANAIICDPEVGDIGVAVFTDRDISAVKANKAQSNPGSRRRFDMADGVYLFGVLNGAPQQYVRFTSTGLELVDKNGNSIVMDASGITITGAAVAITGALTNNGVDVGSTHTHTGVTPGGGVTGPPV